MALDHPVRVRGLGLDARFRSMLDVFFTRSGRGSYTFSDETADLIVVDMDALGAREEYAEYQGKNTDLPTILFSLGDREHRTRGKTILLRKPFTVRQLQSAFEILTIRYLGGIPVPVEKPFDESQAVTQQRQKVVRETVEEERDRRIRARAEKQQAKKERERERQEKWNRQKQEKLNLTEPQAVGSREAIETTEVAPEKVTSKKAGTSKAASSLSRQEDYVKLDTLMAEASAGKGEIKEYTPAHYLQAKLVEARKKALKQKKNAVIRLGSGVITIDPRQELAQVRMGDYQLREVSSFPLKKDDFKFEIVPVSQAAVDEEGRGRIVSLRSLIWKTALYAARGRVPAGTDLNEALQLQRWPNLTRLLLVPGAVRMSALWTSQASTVGGLARQLNLPLHDVTSFYSAAHALDLFVVAGGVTPVAGPKKATSRQGGIFSRILKRLKAFT